MSDDLSDDEVEDLKLLALADSWKRGDRVVWSDRDSEGWRALAVELRQAVEIRRARRAR